MRSVKFIKMQGLGNDFVIFFWDEPLPPKRKIQLIANRKKGVGCDLLVFLKKLDGKLANYEANFFNSDGSEAEICGNALRCVGKLFFEKNQIKNSLIETKAGLIDVEYINEEKIMVNIGVPKFKWQEIPMSKNLNYTDLGFNNKYLKKGFAVNIGNPHLIFFSEVLDGTFQTATSQSGGYLHVSFASCEKNSNFTCGTIKKAFSNGKINEKYENLGKLIVWDMVFDGNGKFKNGKIWDPSENKEDGSPKIYNSKMTLNENILKVEGCILFFCKGQDWKKID